MNDWKKRAMQLRLNPELRRISMLAAAVQVIVLAAGIYRGWLTAAAAVLAVAVIELLLRRLLDASTQRFDEQGARDRERLDVEAAFREIRAQRHDFLAHAGAMQFMLEEERFVEARTYLNKLIGEYDSTSHSMRGEKAHTAALLLKYSQQAEAAGIRMTIDLVTPLSELPMPATDQSKLISNILSNAIEAAEASGAADPYVKITSLVGGGLYVLEVENSTAAIEAELADRLFRSYGVSTKGGAHRGIGTFVIASLMESYNGRLEFSAVKDRFVLKIKVPVIK